jgi:hypothetical protein
VGAAWLKQPQACARGGDLSFAAAAGWLAHRMADGLTYCLPACLRLPGWLAGWMAGLLVC